MKVEGMVEVMMMGVGRVCGCSCQRMEVKRKTRGKNGGVCGWIGDADADDCVCVAILILTLIWTWILSENEVYVWTFAFELGPSWERGFSRVVYDCVDGGGSARLLCRYCRFGHAFFFVCRVVRRRFCLYAIVVNVGGDAYRHLGVVSSGNGHLRFLVPSLYALVENYLLHGCYH